MGEFIPMTTASRVFTDVRDFAAFVRENEDAFFPILARTILDGQRAQIHRSENEVTIYNDAGVDVTATYKDLLREFVVNTWPKHAVLEGTIMGWVGADGHLAGDFVPLVEHARAKSFSFVLSDIKEVGGSSLVEENAYHRLFSLWRWFPANGADRFHLPMFSGGWWMGHLAWAVNALNLGPGYLGISFEHVDSGILTELRDPQMEFAKTAAKFDFSHGFELRVGDLKVTPHFAVPDDATPDYIFIEGPAFPHGKLIDGGGQKFDYPKEAVARATLTAQARGRSMAFVNFSHLDGQDVLAGQIVKLWWDPAKKFNFDDHTGRHIEGEGMLMHKSIITNETAIWNIMRGKIRAISVEPMFDVVTNDGREWEEIDNMAITALALTNHPAIGNATINKICTSDGTCTTVSE